MKTKLSIIVLFAALASSCATTKTAYLAEDDAYYSLADSRREYRKAMQQQARADQLADNGEVKDNNNSGNTVIVNNYYYKRTPRVNYVYSYPYAAGYFNYGPSYYYGISTFYVNSYGFGPGYHGFYYGNPMSSFNYFHNPYYFNQFGYNHWGYSPWGYNPWGFGYGNWNYPYYGYNAYLGYNPWLYGNPYYYSGYGYGYGYNYGGYGWGGYYSPQVVNYTWAQHGSSGTYFGTQSQGVDGTVFTGNVKDDAIAGTIGGGRSNYEIAYSKPSSSKPGTVSEFDLGNTKPNSGRNPVYNSDVSSGNTSLNGNVGTVGGTTPTTSGRGNVSNVDASNKPSTSGRVYENSSTSTVQPVSGRGNYNNSSENYQNNNNTSNRGVSNSGRTTVPSTSGRGSINNSNIQTSPSTQPSQGRGNNSYNNINNQSSPSRGMNNSNSYQQSAPSRSSSPSSGFNNSSNMNSAPSRSYSAPSTPSSSGSIGRGSSPSSSPSSGGRR